MEKIINYFRGIGNALKNRDIFVALMIILVAFASFGLGRLSKLSESREPIRIEDISGSSGAAASASVVSTPSGKNYVASKNGTKYYLTWCASADRINEANKVWFDTKEEAEKAGYAPAANCPGL